MASAVEREIGTVLFDVGAVLVDWVPDFADVRRVFSLPLQIADEQLATAFWKYRPYYDESSNAGEYWAKVLAALDLPAPSATSVTDMELIDWRDWSRDIPESIALASDLAAQGIRLAVLSNAPLCFSKRCRGQEWARYFDEMVFSAEVGVAKPAPEIYEIILRRLDLPAAKVLFFDDSPVNIAAAAAAGLQTHLWQSAAAAREFLASHGM